MVTSDGQAWDGMATAGGDVTVLRYDVPHYRMRGLCRRLDSLSAACSGRGIELGYELRGDIQSQPADMRDEGETGGRRRVGPSYGFDAPQFMMDHVTLRDGVRADGCHIVAVIDRHAAQVRPLSCEDETGRVLADEWWLQEMESNPARYQRRLRRDDQGYSITPDGDGAPDEVGMSDALVGSPATCSACGKAVANGITYLVMDEESEELLQVGGCCISKRANGLPSRYVSRYADILSRMALHSSPAGLATLPSAADAVPANLIVAGALRDMETSGYSRWRDAGTSCTWWSAMWSAKNGARAATLAGGIADRLDEADQAIGWAREGFPGLPPGKWIDAIAADASEIREGYVECRFADGIAPIALLWHRHRAYLRIRSHAEWIDPSGSDWVGEPGERIRRRVVRIENMSRMQIMSPVGKGLRDLNALLTDEGDVIIWRTTLDLSDVAKAISQESPVLLDATVLRHQEYLGMRETVVTRGRLREPDGRGVAGIPKLNR